MAPCTFHLYANWIKHCFFSRLKKWLGAPPIVGSSPLGWRSGRRGCQYTPGKTHRKGPNLSSPGFFPQHCPCVKIQSSKDFGKCLTSLICEHQQQFKCRETNSLLGHQTFIHIFTCSFISTQGLRIILLQCFCSVCAAFWVFLLPSSELPILMNLAHCEAPSPLTPY